MRKSFIFFLLERKTLQNIDTCEESKVIFCDLYNCDLFYNN